MSSYIGQQLHEAELRYKHEQQFNKLVELLQQTWPNIHLKIANTYCHNKVICVIINEEFLPVITIEPSDYISDVEIYNHIVNYLSNLKKIKRQIIMNKLLKVD